MGSNLIQAFEYLKTNFEGKTQIKSAFLLFLSRDLFIHTPKLLSTLYLTSTSNFIFCLLYFSLDVVSGGADSSCV